VRELSVADDPEEPSYRRKYPHSSLDVHFFFGITTHAPAPAILIALRLTPSPPPCLQLAELGSKYEPAEGITGI
jgi:hypothetical protein